MQNIEMLDKIAAEKMAKFENTPGWDAEDVHSAADKLLCEILTELGYTKTVEAFNSLEKWYS